MRHAAPARSQSIGAICEDLTCTLQHPPRHCFALRPRQLGQCRFQILAPRGTRISSCRPPAEHEIPAASGKPRRFVQAFTPSRSLRALCPRLAFCYPSRLRLGMPRTAIATQLRQILTPAFHTDQTPRHLSKISQQKTPNRFRRAQFLMMVSPIQAANHACEVPE